jgi:antitoxin (DNA-binding transcriptional repressor) of toxin-antitoxin stability system
MVIYSDQSGYVSTGGDSMRKIGAAKFKEQCLSLLDRLTPEGLIITKHGKPVARLIPLGSPSADLIGSLKGRIDIRGDLLGTGARWDADAQP